MGLYINDPRLVLGKEYFKDALYKVRTSVIIIIQFFKYMYLIFIYHIYLLCISLCVCMWTHVYSDCSGL